jgi:hypothetical protein
MPPDTTLTPCCNALAAPRAALPVAAGWLAWWRRLWVPMPDAADTLAELDPRTLQDIGWCTDQVRHRDDLSAPAHRMPNFW